MNSRLIALISVCSWIPTTAFGDPQFSGFSAPWSVEAGALPARVQTWLDSVQARVVRLGPASASLVKQNRAGLGIILSAHHVVAEASGIALGDVPEVLALSQVSDLSVIQDSNPDDEFGSGRMFNPAWTLYRSELTAEQRAHGFRLLRAGSDIVVALMTGDLLSTSSPVDENAGFPRTPLRVKLSPSRIADIQGGEWLLCVGYPRGSAKSFVIAPVLGAQNAGKLLQRSAVPYAADEEFVVQAQGKVGMSGGACFTESGAHAGVMHKALLSHDSSQGYIRVIRTRFIERRLNERLGQSLGRRWLE